MRHLGWSHGARQARGGRAGGVVEIGQDRPGQGSSALFSARASSDRSVRRRRVRVAGWCGPAVTSSPIAAHQSAKGRRRRAGAGGRGGLRVTASAPSRRGRGRRAAAPLSWCRRRRGTRRSARPRSRSRLATRPRCRRPAAAVAAAGCHNCGPTDRPSRRRRRRPTRRARRGRRPSRRGRRSGVGAVRARSR